MARKPPPAPRCFPVRPHQLDRLLPSPVDPCGGLGLHPGLMGTDAICMRAAPPPTDCVAWRAVWTERTGAAGGGRHPRAHAPYRAPATAPACFTPSPLEDMLEPRGPCGPRWGIERGGQSNAPNAGWASCTGSGSVAGSGGVVRMLPWPPVRDEEAHGGLQWLHSLQQVRAIFKTRHRFIGIQRRETTERLPEARKTPILCGSAGMSSVFALHRCYHACPDHPEGKGLCSESSTYCYIFVYIIWRYESCANQPAQQNVLSASILILPINIVICGGVRCSKIVARPPCRYDFVEVYFHLLIQS
jgi:hypothetical protein